MTKIAILDDWQDLARSSADWSGLASRADLTFFADAFDTEDAAAAALADFDILLTMRERTACPETLLRRLPKLRMIGITSARHPGPCDLRAPRHRRLPYGGRRTRRSLRDHGIGAWAADSRGSGNRGRRREYADWRLSARRSRRHRSCRQDVGNYWARSARRPNGALRRRARNESDCLEDSEPHRSQSASRRRAFSREVGTDGQVRCDLSAYGSLAPKSRHHWGPKTGRMKKGAISGQYLPEARWLTKPR